MARVRIQSRQVRNARLQQRPAWSMRRPLTPREMDYRPSSYEEPDERYEEEARPRRRPAVIREPEYDYKEPQTDEEYGDDYEDESEVVSRPTRPRAPMHGQRVRGYREPVRETRHSEPRRMRRRKATAVEDMFYIPVEEIPEGSSYEWKRWSVSGQEDPFYLAQMREQGWEPVSPKRHPTWVPPGYNQPHILKGGMILMERPIELTEEARAEQKVLARTQVREAEARLGRTPGNTLNRLAPKITKEVMRAVPLGEE